MTTWAKFDIWNDRLELDNQVLHRPSYMSVMQWREWCEAIENPINADEIYREVEQEHEAELDDKYEEGFNDGRSADERALESEYARGYDEGFEEGRKIAEDKAFCDGS